MTVPADHHPFGLRDVKVRTITGGVRGTGIDVGAAQTLEFTSAEDVETLRGDDGVVAIRGKGGVVNWSLDQGGYTPAAFVAFSGTTLTTSGTTPAQQVKITGASTDVRPYVELEGLSIADEGGDFHAMLYMAKATGDIKGTMADGAFWTTGFAGMAIGDVAQDNAIYDLIWNETSVPLA